MAPCKTGGTINRLLFFNLGGVRIAVSRKKKREHKSEQTGRNVIGDLSECPYSFVTPAKFLTEVGRVANHFTQEYSYLKIMLL